MKRSMLLVVPIVAALMLGACGGDDNADNSNSDGEPTVFTVPQLESIVTKVVDAYNDENPDSEISVTAENKAATEQSVKSKAPGVAVLPKVWLDPVRAPLHSDGFGRDLFVVLVPADNPAQVTELADYQSLPGSRRAFCGVFTPPDCEATVVQQLEAKQLDAAVMWRGGVPQSDNLKQLPIPEEDNFVIGVSYVVMGDSAEAVGFGKFLQSEPARKLLTENGLLP